MLEHAPHACVFDAYGTLFDIHSAVNRLRERLDDKADAIAATWRRKQLEYTWLRSLMGEYADFEQVLQDSLQYALTQANRNDSTLRDDLLNGYRQLDCFPEVPAVLGALKERGLAVTILSNGTRAMVESCVRHAGLQDLIDDILSVDSVRIYKPSPRVYELAVDRYGPPVPGIAFHSANAWDIAGAAYFGFSCIWINRGSVNPEVLPGKAACTLPDLSGLPELIASTGS